MKKAPRKVRRRPSGRDRRPRHDDLVGYDDPEEAVALIAESVPVLAKLARRHKLGMLAHLLGMTLMEAEEYLRLRSKRKLS